MNNQDAEYCIFWIDSWISCSTKTEWIGIFQCLAVLFVILSFIFKAWIKNNARKSIGNCVALLLQFSQHDDFHLGHVSRERAFVVKAKQAHHHANMIAHWLDKYDFGAYEKSILLDLVKSVEKCVPNVDDSSKIVFIARGDGFQPFWEFRKAATRAASLYPGKFISG